MTQIVSGSTTAYLHFVAVSTADHLTRVTGLSAFNVYAAATSASTGSTYGLTVNEVNSTQMPGVYRILLQDSTLMAIGSGVDNREICLHITSSMDPVTLAFDLYRRSVTTGATIAANSSGEVNIKTNSDKTGYALTQTFPTNFASLAISSSGETNIKTNNDKTGYALTQSFPTNFASMSITSSGESLAKLSSGTGTGQISLTGGQVTVAGFAAGALTTAAVNSSVMTAFADALLDRDMSAGVDSGSSSFRTPRQALRADRNEWNISGGTLTIYKEDGVTPSWTAAVTGTSGADPITSFDPA